MEECLNHIVTHAPYIWQDPILPPLTKSILLKFRTFVIFVFKPKIAENYGITANIAFDNFNRMCEEIERNGLT